MSKKHIVEFIKVDEPPKPGDFVMEDGTNHVGILGEEFYTDTGMSRVLNLDGSWYDDIDMFCKVVPRYKKLSWYHKLLL
jgi:hypothetical protein